MFCLISSIHKGKGRCLCLLDNCGSIRRIWFEVSEKIAQNVYCFKILEQYLEFKTGRQNLSALKSSDVSMKFQNDNKCEQFLTQFINKSILFCHHHTQYLFSSIYYFIYLFSPPKLAE